MKRRAVSVLVSVSVSALCAFACVTLVGCGGGQRASGAPEKEPEVALGAAGPEPVENVTRMARPDLAALAAREAQGLEKRDVVGPEKGWTAKVDAAAAPEVSRSDGVDVMNASLGGEAPLHCEFYAEALDAAGSIRGLLELVGKDVQFRSIAPWDVRVVNEAPALYVRAFYLSKLPGKKGLGQLKVALYTGNDHRVVCVHDELGYEKTFLDVTSALFESIARPEPASATPAFVELETARLGDVPVGFSMTRVELEAGKRVIKASTSMMLPASQTDVLFTDTWSSQVIDDAGRLTKGVWVQTIMGKVELNVRVEREKGASYRYVGEVQQEPVKGSFKVGNPAGLGTPVSLARSLVKANKAGAFEVKDESYDPNIDPAKATLATYTREKTDPKNSVRGTMGDVKMSGHLDENGLFDQVEVPMGGATLTIRREIARGKLK